MKQRNTGQIVDKHGCGFPVYTYIHANGSKIFMDGPGTQSGPCGTKKDHTRNYCCQKCKSHYGL